MKKDLVCLHENEDSSVHQCDCVDCYVKYIEELENEIDELKQDIENIELEQHAVKI